MPPDLAALIPQVAMPGEWEGLRFETLSVEHGPEVVDLFERVFGIGMSVAQWEWKFWRNPAGPPVGMAVRHLESGKLVGMNTGRLRKFQIGEHVGLAMQAADNAVDPEFRGGQLFRAVTGGMVGSAHQGGVLFAYGSQATDFSLRIGRRYFNYQDLQVMRPWEVRLASGGGTGLRKIIRHLRGVLRNSTQGLDACTVGFDFMLDPPYGVLLDEVWERSRKDWNIVGLRDATYLAWRWGACPVGRHRLLLIQQAGVPVGWVVLRFEEEGGVPIARALDWFFGNHLGVVRALFARAALFVRDEGAAFLFFNTSDSSLVAEAATNLPGFQRSDRQPDDKLVGTVMVQPHGNEHTWTCQRALLQGDSWFYTQGDADFRD